MFILISETIIVGIITFVIGTIIFNLSINKSNNDKKQPYGVDLAFFTTGVIIHLIIEFFGLNN
jgi:hypothetical protein